MVINNISAILIQIICFIIYFVIAFFLRDFTIGGVILSIFIWLIYIFSGTKLTPQDSIIKNLLSVSSIGLLGIVTLLLGQINESRNFFSELLAVFVAPGMGVILLFPKYIISNKVAATLVFCIIFCIPTVLMWIGLQWKAKHINRKQLQ